MPCRSLTTTPALPVATVRSVVIPLVPLIKSTTPEAPAALIAPGLASNLENERSSSADSTPSGKPRVTRASVRQSSTRNPAVSRSHLNGSYSNRLNQPQLRYAELGLLARLLIVLNGATKSVRENSSADRSRR